MVVDFRRLVKPTVGAAAALAVLLAASCAPQYSSPQQLQASNPSVTYKYHNDQELLQVNQTAVTFCNQYHAVPRANSFTNSPDGSKVVVFECLQLATAMPSAAQFNPNLTYTYRTDQELLDASRNAQVYCMNSGSSQVISNVVTNADGSRSVAFRCSRP